MPKSEHPTPKLDNLVASGKLSQAEMDKYKDTQNVILNVGILCQLKSDIYKALDDKKQCTDWMDMAQYSFNIFFLEETVPLTMQGKLLYM